MAELAAADEKRESGFFLDIKGSKFHKFEKHSPAASFQVQAGGSELLPFTSKAPWRTAVFH